MILWSQVEELDPHMMVPCFCFFSIFSNDALNKRYYLLGSRNRFWSEAGISQTDHQPYGSVESTTAILCQPDRRTNKRYSPNGTFPRTFRSFFRWRRYMGGAFNSFSVVPDNALTRGMISPWFVSQENFVFSLEFHCCSRKCCTVWLPSFLYLQNVNVH